MRTASIQAGLRVAVTIAGAATALAAPRAAAEGVVINELMAVNRTTLTNSLGKASDWIELHNASSNAVDLAGWHLTDNADDPDKWTFPPGTLIGAFDYLLVFASGQTNPLVGTELHANFQLDGGGEYLGLVGPDGATVVHEYAPAYPPQAADISFGLRPDTTDLVLLATNAAYRYRIPADGALGLTWTAADGFDDSGWSAGAGGLGHEWPTTNFAALIQTRAPAAPGVPTAGVYARCAFTLEQAARIDVLRLNARYNDGLVVYLNGVPAAARNAPAAPAWDSLASEKRSVEESKYFSEIDLSPAVGALRDGTNVLAVHVLNAETSSRISDLLYAGRLDGLIMTPSVTGERRYFHAPSPGRENQLGQLDFIPPVAFSVERGYYDEPFDLELSVPSPGATIRYTLDGVEPTATNGAPYTGPLRIDRTTVLRARAFKGDYEPSRVATHTYLFIEDIKRQPVMRYGVVNHAEYGPQMREAFLSVRTISLVTDRDHIFGAARGIYTHPLSRGEEWERPVSAEVMDPRGGDNCQIDCGVRIYGGWSRDHTSKKSWRLLFKDRYGPTKLRYDMFREASASTAFDTLILRGGYNDQFTRFGLNDPFVRRLQIEAGGVGSRSAFAHVFINGEYWGLYNVAERPDQAFAATYMGGEKESWDAINADEPCGESLLDTWSQMLAAVSLGLSDPVQYQRLQGNNPDGTRNPDYVVHLDVDNHADYMLVNLWAGTTDWPGHNWYAAGRRVDGTGWKFFCWDAEGAFYSSPTYNLTGTGGPRSIFSRLRQSPEFTLRFGDRVQRHCFDGGALTPAQATRVFQEMADEVVVAEIADAARWGTEATPASWRGRRDTMLNTYLPQRTELLLQQLRVCGLYPAVDAPVFSQRGGLYAEGFKLRITASNAVYYTTDGHDPRAVGSGAPVGQLYSGPIELQGSTLVKARARDASGQWSALTEALFVAPQAPAWLRISEVMPHPASPPEGSPYTAGDFEFIEVVNTGPAPLNLRYVQFTDGIRFVFPNLNLGAGQYAVAVRNAEAFASRYGTSGILIAGRYEGALNDAGERVRLEASPAGPEIAALEFGDSRAWPLAADGAGHSLVPLVLDGQAAGALNYAGNWRASTYRGGSPGRADPPPVRDVMLNEIVAHTDYSDPEHPEYDSNDWLELFNTRTAAVSLADWYLSDSADDLKKWAIPATNVLGGGAWRVFDELTGFHNPLDTGFGLSKDGECVYLSYLPGTAADRVADCLRFKAQERDAALGRYPDGGARWFAMDPTPNGPNGEARRDVLINEIMYHPAPTEIHPEDNTDDEYVELVNPFDAAVALWNEAGPWRMDGGTAFLFPTGVTLAARETVLVVPFDPLDTNAVAAFRGTYGLTNGAARLFGPFSGKLSNRGDRVALERPQSRDLPETGIAWVVVDEVTYFDQHPWPPEADGSGYPLQRIARTGAGNDPASWSAAYVASPGGPRAKIAIGAPHYGATFFVPFVTTVHVAIDEGQVEGAIQHVEFLKGTNTLFLDTEVPYECALGPVTEPGEYALAARIVDESGATLSRPVTIHALRLETEGGATNLTDTTAALSGALQGSGRANLTVYWGPADGGEDPAAWADSKTLAGREAGAFQANIAGLQPSHTYYYRWHAQSAVDERWSAHSASFRTMAYTRWAKRMRIRFPGYQGDSRLAGFPALLVLSTNIAGFDYADFAWSDGRDLRFADDSGLVPLNYEVEEWNTNGTSLIWVCVPELAKDMRGIYALWGNPDIAGAPPCTMDGTTWDASFASVWHLGYNLRDATPNRIEAESSGAVPTNGLIGLCRAFDGEDDVIHLGIHKRTLAAHIRNLTVSCWVRPSRDFRGVPLGVVDASLGDSLYMAAPRGVWNYTVKSASRSVHAIAMDAWQLLTVVLDGNRAYGYWNDGAAVDLGAYPDFEPASGLAVGSHAGDSAHFCGLVDEVRISAVARSADWVRATYRTTVENGAFTSYELAPLSDGDDDDDGLPDEWEVQHFGGLYRPGGEPAEDWDGDGFGNEAEFLSGTDPADEADRFLLDFDAVAPTTVVRFATRRTGLFQEDCDRYYALDVATNLTPPEWSAVADYTNILGADQLVTCTNVLPEAAPVFYRGRVRIERR